MPYLDTMPGWIRRSPIKLGHLLHYQRDNAAVKQYRELTLHEALDAKIAGKEVEYQDRHNNEWHEGSTLVLTLMHKYRIEIEAPKQGDMVHVREEGWKEFSIELVELRAIVDGKFVCKDEDGDLMVWDEIKPIEPKPVAREGWVHPRYIDPDKGNPDRIFVREIAGDV